MSAIKKKITFNSPSEIHEFEWEIKNFKSLLQLKEDEFNERINFIFEAGNEIGVLSKWKFSLEKYGKYLMNLQMIEGQTETPTFASFIVNGKIPCPETIFNSTIHDYSRNASNARRFNIMDHLATGTKFDSYLVESSITFHITFNLIGQLQSKLSTESTTSLQTTSRMKLGEDFFGLLESGTNSDFILRTNDATEFRVHKNILAARSPVFAAMFASKMEESVTGSVNVKDISGPTMKVLLNYIYSGEFKEEQLEIGDVSKVIGAAEEYSLPELKDFYGRMLIKICTLENAFDLMKLADIYKLEEAYKDISDYIKTNLSSIIKFY